MFSDRSIKTNPRDRVPGAPFGRIPRMAQILRAGLLVGWAVLLHACANPEPVQQEVASDPVDMSGNWELDYGLSDNLQTRLNVMARSLRGQMARAETERQRAIQVGSASSTQETMIGLAQMAELITQSQLLEIEQDRISIRVEREGNFSLSCDYGPGAPAQLDYGVGSERCFWDGQQLVFQIRLPDGLDIVHRLSVASNRQTLGIVSSLYDRSLSEPFTIRRVYRRYVPGSSGYRCTETLTRGRVCTTESK